jgi:glycosyltransferase involved in cell wall biosynthesis
VVPGAPLAAVVVPSHGRPLRLRWLLEALAEQDLPRAAFEVHVVHDDPPGGETERLLAGHRLGVAAQRVAPCGPARKRNAGWRAARAPLVVFTDDDCRPPATWLSRLVAACHGAGAPGRDAVVQGAVVPDPDELAVLHHAPWARSQEVHPPSPYGQTANIAYPRALLERLGGFDEAFPVAAGEDTDLVVRAQQAGAVVVAAPQVEVFHAVFDLGLRGRLAEAWRWQHLAGVLRRHPQLRRHLVLGVFWKADHALLLLAAAGLVAGGRRSSLLALPYVAHRLGGYGRSPRGRARAAAELPARMLVDATEIAAAARGALRARTPFL